MNEWMNEWMMNDEWMNEWMNEKKRFSDFAETLHINSTPQENFEIFLVKLENFLMGLKLDFEFWNFGQIYKRFPAKKFYKGISLINFDFLRSEHFTKEFPYKIFIRGFLL